MGFPLTDLDMLPFLAPDVNATNTRYKLVALIHHLGAVSTGHYIAYGLNQATGTWNEFDDSKVRSVSAARVADEQAYVLMYQKMDSSDVDYTERCNLIELVRHGTG